MTTPAVNIVNLPYGATVEGDGKERAARIATKTANKADDYRLELPNGPCRVVASWNGPEAVRVTQVGVGYPVEIPAGSGTRSGTAVVGGKGERLQLENQGSAALKAGGRGTLEVYPLFNQ